MVLNLQIYYLFGFIEVEVYCLKDIRIKLFILQVYFSEELKAIAKLHFCIYLIINFIFIY